MTLKTQATALVAITAGLVSAAADLQAAGAMIEVNGERGPLRLSGFACAPSVTRATAAGQTLVVNGRPVADPLLRTWVRLYARATPPSEDDIAREVQRYALPRLPQAPEAPSALNEVSYSIAAAPASGPSGLIEID